MGGRLCLAASSRSRGGFKGGGGGGCVAVVVVVVVEEPGGNGLSIARHVSPTTPRQSSVRGGQAVVEDARAAGGPPVLGPGTANLGRCTDPAEEESRPESVKRGDSSDRARPELDGRRGEPACLDDVEAEEYVDRASRWPYVAAG